MALRPIEFRRLRGEDFPPDDQALVSKIAFSYNNFGDQVISIVNGNITIDNLKREISVVKLQVDSTGSPLVDVKIVLQKVTNVLGINVIRVLNLTTPGIPPLAAPYATWTQSSSTVTITNVLGLDDSQAYQITLEIL